MTLLLVSCFGDKSKTVFSPKVEDYVALSKTILSVSVIADSLDVPWDVQYNHYDSSLYFTEIKGAISRLDLATGKRKQLFVIPEVYHHRTLGLLGMALHPDFKAYPYVYVSYTTKYQDSIYSRLERFTYKKDTLTNPKVLLEIEGSTGHNGARLAFSKNGKLLWATGDVDSPTHAQDSTTLNGKILRIEWDGSVPIDNPIQGSYVYAWGFRNMQGLTVSDRGYVYTSEHGDAIEDEVNIIEPLRNYGWPVIEGKHDLPAEIAYAKQKNTKEPMRSWTPVIAPAGLAYYNSDQIPEWKNALLLTTLKSQSLRVLKLDESGKKIISEEIFFENHYGRLRTLTVSPSGDIYLATSNRDWNPQAGFPKTGDDKILRINRVAKALKTPLKGRLVTGTKEAVKTGTALYNAYCVSCHKGDGAGLGQVFPALKNSTKVNGDKAGLINLFLNGSVKPGKTEQMPAFNFLSDEDAASILSYIRKSWGNHSLAITPADIKKYRK
ncbi:PQQ-dependent sugar dehydrogenase [Pseudopedobacter beijingensis]|uniref:PQQ-dependent sugar dehydrogenase n=1 Tax=Pseudopedobacter beijingensis TaxID=1207056 RepID=A0ABW4I8B9_9SPHI